jgi:2-polyprenyl-6-hydroxyphenyl methylase/3-demethylubiquinone-9 3-methyltransferase
MSADASSQIAAGDRFAFGENWARFLELLGPERIAAAEASLRTRLDVAADDDLTGRSFIDIGSGSGLFSLAARNLGATVHSFDFDPQSVACTAELRSRYHTGDPGWTVEQGSALDTDYLDKLGEFDIVYSWGVLHHTGAMWDALANVAPLVAPGGQLFIAIYNDQGQASNRWARVKQRYNRSGPGQRRAILAGVRAYQAAKPLPTLVASQAYHVAQHGRLRRLPKADVAPARGMDRDRDLVDWVGGWPFEVATPEAIFDFYRDRGFTLVHLLTCGGGLGCNEFVFRRD